MIKLITLTFILGLLVGLFIDSYDSLTITHILLISIFISNIFIFLGVLKKNNEYVEDFTILKKKESIIHEGEELPKGHELVTVFEENGETKYLTEEVENDR